MGVIFAIFYINIDVGQAFCIMVNNWIFLAMIRLKLCKDFSICFLSQLSNQLYYISNYYLDLILFNLFIKYNNNNNNNDDDVYLH